MVIDDFVVDVDLFLFLEKNKLFPGVFCVIQREIQ